MLLWVMLPTRSFSFLLPLKLPWPLQDPGRPALNDCQLPPAADGSCQDSWIELVLLTLAADRLGETCPLAGPVQHTWRMMLTRKQTEKLSIGITNITWQPAIMQAPKFVECCCGGRSFSPVVAHHKERPEHGTLRQPVRRPDPPASNPNEANYDTSQVSDLDRPVKRN